MNALDLIGYLSDDDEITTEADVSGSGTKQLPFVNTTESSVGQAILGDQYSLDTKVNSETEETVKYYLRLKRESGFDLTDNIRSNKNFGNPYIFSQVAEHFDIDEVFCTLVYFI